MFDRYLICEEGFANVVQDGKVTGFQLKVRITYYRGIALSLVEGFEISVDGKKYERNQVRFSVRDRSFTFSEMETAVNDRWEFGEVATLTIPAPGGLAPGKHQVEVLEHLRISYLPWPSVTGDKKALTLAA
jgi:Domain of unknown function (DUF6379)